MSKRTENQVKFWTDLQAQLHLLRDPFSIGTIAAASSCRLLGGDSGVSYSLDVLFDEQHMRVNVYSTKTGQFDQLFKNRIFIEHAFGNVLIWERKDGSAPWSAYFEMPGPDESTPTSWPEYIQKLINQMILLQTSTKAFL